MSWSLESGYAIKSTTPSDIFEHLPTLRRYASECSSVVECGVREVVSSYAFACALKGRPNTSLTLVDPYKSPNVTEFIEQCKREGLDASFVHDSDLKCPLIKTDMLFIDTWHIYGQMKRELEYWNSHVAKYIVMHDTTVDEWFGETYRMGMNAKQQSIDSGFPMSEIMRGIWPAIEEFLAAHPEWELRERFTNNNGLTILARISG